MKEITFTFYSLTEITANGRTRKILRYIASGTGIYLLYQIPEFYESN